MVGHEMCKGILRLLLSRLTCTGGATSLPIEARAVKEKSRASLCAQTEKPWSFLHLQPLIHYPNLPVSPLYCDMIVSAGESHFFFLMSDLIVLSTLKSIEFGYFQCLW